MYAWPVPLLDGRTCKDHVDEDVEEAYTCVSSVAILERTGSTHGGRIMGMIWRIMGGLDRLFSRMRSHYPIGRAGRTKTFAL